MLHKSHYWRGCFGFFEGQVLGGCYEIAMALLLCMGRLYSRCMVEKNQPPDCDLRIGRLLHDDDFPVFEKD
jgi:hypothetical protein